MDYFKLPAEACIIPPPMTLQLPNSSRQYLEHDLSAGVAGFAQLLRFGGLLQWQQRFDVHFDYSFYDQVGNGDQLLAVRFLADEKSAGSVRGGFFRGRRLDEGCQNASSFQHLP